MYIRRKTDLCDSFDIVGSFDVVDNPMPLFIHLIHQMPTIGQMPLSFTKGYRNTSDSADGTCITKREKSRKPVYPIIRGFYRSRGGGRVSTPAGG
jgi:hypothetical protein